VSDETLSGNGSRPPAVPALRVLAALLGGSSAKVSRMATPSKSIQDGGDQRMDATSTRLG
jgi:hypothetical protein